MVLVTMYMALNCVVMTRSSLMRMSMLMTRTRSHSDTEPCCGTCHDTTPVSVYNGSSVENILYIHCIEN